MIPGKLNMPDDINPYLWCTYLDTVSITGFTIEYEAAYHRPDLFLNPQNHAMRNWAVSGH